jgi:hypothetical protein
MQCLVSLPDGLAGYTLPLYNGLAVQKPPAGSTEPLRAPGPIDPTALPNRNRASPRRATNCTRDAEGRQARASYAPLLTTNFSDFVFGDLRPYDLSISRDAFLGRASSVVRRAQ